VLSCLYKLGVSLIAYFNSFGNLINWRLHFSDWNIQMPEIETPMTTLSGPAAWTGSEMITTPEKWLVHLTSDQVEELESAARHFSILGKDIGEVSIDDFPLPTFKYHLRKLQEKLRGGCGVEVIRGLPVKAYSQTFAATIFCGIGAYLGSARSQNAQGHILGHVRDTGASSADPNTRIYLTSERQSFHTDSSDVVGLLCLKDAQKGGRSLLVSALTIYNRMFEERPDLLEKLFEPISTDRRGEVPDGAQTFMNIPVLSWFKGELTVFYQRQYIESAQRLPGAIKLTNVHIEALDMFDALANDPELYLSMQLEPGDMQFVYNHAQMHDRTAFVDWPDPAERRHLLRLWLSLPGDRPLPECFKERYGSIEIGDRGGIITKETRLHAPLD
jgi:Taurine catabolism dioxygenase TauD, TfdA family